MSGVKERILGAVTVMSEEDAVYFWQMIESTFANKEWASIPEETPDEFDLQMLEDIKNDPECKEFVSSDEAMKILGL